MYIRVDREEVIKSKDLIAILDQKSIDNSRIMQEYVDASIDYEIQTKKKPCKSIVITTDNVYFSHLSSATLIKRSYKDFEK